MLAYVFWHWRRPAIDTATYESRLGRFHAALAASPPHGFFESFAVALHGAPWANAGRDADEDWYFVNGSAALDPLNDAAVSAARQGPHDEAAAAAAGGTAGLYRLRLGAPVTAPRHAYWLARPDGMSYPALYELVRGVVATGDGGALWGRQMTLGPAREFCLHTRQPVVVPVPLDALAIGLRGVWSRRA
jgi:hypothetical protein